MVENAWVEIETGINKVDQSRGVNPSVGAIRATIRVISNEERKTSSVGIVARWVTTQLSVGLARRTVVRAVRTVF